MRVVIAYDGSESSRATINFVAKLFQEDDDILLVHAVPDIRQAARVLARGMPLEAIAETKISIEERGRRLLSEAAAHLHLVGRKSTSHLLRGHTVEQICAFSDEQDADLIIMGRRGLNPMASFFLVNVSDGVLEHSRQSVLLGPSTHTQPGSPQNLNLLIGCDQSPLSLQALDFVKHRLKPCVAAAHLVHVVPLDVSYGMIISIDHASVHAQLELAAREWLAELSIQLQQALAPQKVSYEVTREVGDVSRALVEAAQKQQADLVVVGSKGHSAFKRLMVGSVTHKLARYAGKPLLVVR